MKSIPFYPNTKDDTHCYQAALRMVLKVFSPKKNYSWKMLDNMTGKKKDLWTWPMKGWITLRNLGVDVLALEAFDYRAFARNPEGYLRQEFGERVASEQILHSDVNGAAVDAKKAVQKITIQKRIPSFDDLRTLLQDGWLLVCQVNSKKLNRKKGYVGHFVVVWRCTDKMVFLHDPGLPPRRNRRVTKRVFEEAWADPNAKAKGIMAFRL